MIKQVVLLGALCAVVGCEGEAVKARRLETDDVEGRLLVEAYQKTQDSLHSVSNALEAKNTHKDSVAAQFAEAHALAMGDTVALQKRRYSQAHTAWTDFEAGH